MSALRERFVSAALGSVLLVPAVAFSLVSSESFRLPKLLVGEGLVGLAAIGFLAVFRRGLFQSGWWSLAWFPTVLAAAISLANTSHLLTGIQELSRIFFLALFFFLLSRAGNPFRLLGFVILAGAANSVLALAQWEGLRFSWWVPWSGRHGVYGTFGNPNFLAEYLAPVFLLSLAASLTGSGARPRIAAGAVAGLVFSALLFTVSRAAWLGVLAGAAVFVFLARREFLSPEVRRRGAVMAVVLGAIAIMFWRPLWNRTASSLSFDEPGISTRFFMWRVAARIASRSQILGAGPGGYGLGYLDAAAEIQESEGMRPSYAGITHDAHNDYFQLASERGLLGAAAWVLAFGWIVSRAFRGIAGTAGRERIMRSAALGGTAAVMATAFFGFPMRIFPTAALFVWMLACAQGPVREDGGAWVKGAVLAVLIAVLPFMALAARSLMADSYAGARFGEKSSEKRIRNGLKLLPAEGALHFKLGVILLNQGRMAEASKEFRAALPGFKDPDVLFNLGFIALRTGDYAAAVSHFREGLRMYPYYRSNAYTDLAEALLGLGRREEARDAAKRALAIEPGYPRAAAILRRIER